MCAIENLHLLDLVDSRRNDLYVTIYGEGYRPDMPIKKGKNDLVRQFILSADSAQIALYFSLFTHAAYFYPDTIRSDREIELRQVTPKDIIRTKLAMTDKSGISVYNQSIVSFVELEKSVFALFVNADSLALVKTFNSETMQEIRETVLSATQPLMSEIIVDIRQKILLIVSDGVENQTLSLYTYSVGSNSSSFDVLSRMALSFELGPPAFCIAATEPHCTYCLQYQTLNKGQAWLRIVYVSTLARQLLKHLELCKISGRYGELACLRIYEMLFWNDQAQFEQTNQSALPHK